MAPRVEVQQEKEASKGGKIKAKDNEQGFCFLKSFSFSGFESHYKPVLVRCFRSSWLVVLLFSI